MKTETMNLTDHARPDAGDCEILYCGICSAMMSVRRNVSGPTGFAEDMSGRKHLHDSFT